MKTSLYILFIAFSGLMISCDKDDENVLQQDPTIMGTWNLTNIHGGFVGADENFEPGVITWTFKENTSTLIVMNNHASTDGAYDGLETGTYPFTVQSVGHLLIDGTDFIYSVTEAELVIEQNLTDGYTFSFKR